MDQHAVFMKTLVGPWNHVLGGDTEPPWEGAVLGVFLPIDNAL